MGLEYQNGFSIDCLSIKWLTLAFSTCYTLHELERHRHLQEAEAALEAGTVSAFLCYSEPGCTVTDFLR